MHELDKTEPGCPCDRIDFPPKPEIPAGLTDLPRQLAGFPEFRLAMLAGIRSHRLLDGEVGYSPLADWRARGGEDLGVMLLEMWAYVLDVLAFYDERVANEAYLRTADRPESLLRLVGLIGYHPRPALAASVTLALLAEDGKGPVALPAGVAFRSGPFGAEPPQVFETQTPAAIDPRRNEWTLAALRDSSLEDSEFFMNPNDAAISRGDLVLIRWGAATSQMTSTRVTEVVPAEALDGNTYVKVSFQPRPTLDASARPGATVVLTPTLTAGVIKASEFKLNINSLQLDSIQNDIEQEQTVIITRGSLQHHANVESVKKEEAIQKVVKVKVAREKKTVADYDVTPPATPVTRIVISPPIPESWMVTPERLRVHFGMVEAGRLTRPAKHRIGRSDLEPNARFEGVSEPLEPAAQPSGVLLLGDDGFGARLAGTAKVDNAGAGRLEPAQGAGEFPQPLRTPARVFGNLIEASRGESVVNEVLGSGNSALAFQSFGLAKDPLTYLHDPSGPNGRRSTLEVRVNGLLWREVPSFFGIGPGDEAFIVRQNPETGQSIITFGDGQTGARLSTGVNNIVASYRFGAGAASPPNNSITQLARPVPGIRSAENPVAAGGGADGDQPKDLRRNAPDSALLLGRAVSLQDFEALARQSSVINAYADWTWDNTTQRAVVKIWFIDSNDDRVKNERQLRKTLLGQADPNTPLAACQATPEPADLVIDLIVDPRHNSDEVELAVADALTNPESGLLALENIPIGGPLFRSAVLEQILSVDGAESVRALTINRQPFGATLTPEKGQFYNFLPQLVVGNTAAGDVLFAKATAENSSNIPAFAKFMREVQLIVGPLVETATRNIDG